MIEEYEWFSIQIHTTWVTLGELELEPPQSVARRLPVAELANTAAARKHTARRSFQRKLKSCLFSRPGDPGQRSRIAQAR
jgi:hypothetical protein